MTHTRQTTRAFTIIELIVALAITVVMLFLINQLFTVTSNAVSLGVGLSDVIGSGRAVGDQIERDSQRIIPPGSADTGGVMVIINQKIAGVQYYDRFVTKNRDVWSCQLMFLRSLNNSTNNFGDSPMAPSSQANYSPPRHNQVTYANAVMKVWYGHVQKVNPDGTDAGILGAQGPNLVATNWTLGRHVLFMVTTSADIDGTNGGVAEPDKKPAVIRANGGWATAPVIGYTSIATDLPGVVPQIYSGITDVADFAHANINHVRGTMVANDSAVAGGASPANTLFASDLDLQYATKALQYVFVNQRLRALTAPAIIDKTKAFPAAQVAMMHPIFMDNISDFIVEFAGDYIDDPAINGNLPDGAPDTDGQGEIKWYGGGADHPATNSYAFPAAVAGYIQHNPAIAPAVPNGRAYVFRHDAPNSWPYLVRLRYRIHDRRGDLLGERSAEIENAPADDSGLTTTNIGRWFEQIIYVPRP